MKSLQLPHDIIEPAPIGWWPLAPGWWLLMLIVVSATIGLVVWWRRRQQRLAPLKQALRELQGLEQLWRQQQDARAACAALSALLKRVARHCYPSEDIAPLAGAAWQAFLLRTGANAFDECSAASLHQFYQTNTASTPPFAATERWLRAQRTALSKTISPPRSTRHV